MPPALPPVSQSKARILCLHGYAQNADFFRSRTGALRKALKSVADFEFVDAPHPATAEFLGDVPEERGAALGWFNVGETAPGSRPAISANYVGVDAALECVRQTVQEKGPFDGILGFSQGATLAAFCCLHPEAWSGNGTPFRFAILFSAFSPRDPKWSLEAPSPAPPIRNFHCLGLADPSVPPESSRKVAALFAEPIVHEHDGGHGVPSDARLRSALKAFILDSEPDKGMRAMPIPSGPGIPAAEGAAPNVSGTGAECSFTWRYDAWRQLRNPASAASAL